MDTTKQRKAEPQRRAIIGIGVLMSVAGNLPIAMMERGDAALAVIASMLISGGLILTAAGVFSTRYRRWVYSVEDRLAELEKTASGEGKQ